MKKAVVRRGVGAIVLALVAALLLGYLLKGKAPDRKKVVNMETKPSEIQIFPRGKSTGDTSGAAVAGAGAASTSGAGMAGGAASTGGAGMANGAASTGGAKVADKGDAAASEGSAGNKAAGVGAVAAAGAAVAGLFKVMGDKGSDAAEGAGKAVAGAGQSVKDGAQAATSAVAGVGKPEAVRGAFNGSKDQLTDPVSGNAATGKGNIVVDGAGQAVVGKSVGVTQTPAQFSVRAPKTKEVRPSIDRSVAAANKPKAVAPKKKQPAKSNARLVGEKKLAPVGSKSYAKAKQASEKSKGTKKVATSRGSKAAKGKSSKSSKRVASSKGSAPRNKAKRTAKRKATPTRKAKTVVAKKRSTKKPASKKASGRNKYTVQLLATSSSTKAHNLRNTMKREGYSAYVTKGKKAGKNFYRVRLGGFNGKAAAIKKQSSLKRRYRKNAYVQSSVVVKR